jgi:hypothetical protein
MADETTAEAPELEQVIAPADLYVVAISDRVKAGDVVDVDPATAVSLRAQGWETPKKAAPAKAGTGK